MSDTHSMKLEIDATGAKSGADQFSSAVDRIGKSLQNLDKQGSEVFAKLKVNMSGMNLKEAAGQIGSINRLSVNPNLANSIRTLSNALYSFRSPNVNVSAGLELFGHALGTLRTPPIDLSKIAGLANALKGFRAPSTQQTQNMVGFFASLNSVRVPANLDSIVGALQRITNAAKDARASLAGIGSAHVSVPPGLRGGYGGGRRGGGGGRGGAYGPRPTDGGPYDGVFSGSHRATGELRGLENVANPGFQGASVLRTMIPTMTMGESLKGLYEEGNKLTQFQHILEVATTVPDDAIESQKRLAQAMQFGTDISMKYGMELQEVRTAFSKFAVASQASGFGLQTTEKMFEDMSIGLRSMGASGEVVQRVYRAMDQVMQTGHFSMLQLHREIGLQMPAIQIMADALTKLEGKKVTSAEVEKRSKDGKLGSDLAPAFSAEVAAHYAAGLATAMNSPVAALNRLHSTWILTMDSMNAHGLWDKMGEQFNRFAVLLGQSNVQNLMMKISDGLAVVLEKVGDALAFVAKHTEEATRVFKIFLYLGAVEFALRMKDAFSQTASMIERMTKATIAYNAVSAGAGIARGATAGGAVAGAGSAVAGATSGISGAVAAESLGARFVSFGAKVTGVTAAMTILRFIAIGAIATLEAAFAILTAPITLTIAAIGLVTAGLLYMGREGKVAMDGLSSTVGEQWLGMWYRLSDTAISVYDKLTTGAGKMWDTLGKAASEGLTAMQPYFDTFASYITKAFLGALATMENMWNFAHRQFDGSGGAAVGREAREPNSYDEHGRLVIGSAPQKPFSASLGKNSPPTATALTQAQANIDAVERHKAAAALEEFKKFQGDQGNTNTTGHDKRDIMEFDQPKQEKDNPSVNNLHKGGKSQFEKDEDKFKRLLENISPLNKALLEYKDGMELTAKMEASHKFTTEQLAQARAGLTDRMRDHLKTFFPAIHATKELADAEQYLTALTKTNGADGNPLISIAQKAQALEDLREKLGKLIDPYRAYLDELDRETKLAKLGPEARAQQSAEDALTKAMRRDGKGAPTDGQLAEVREKAKLLRQAKLDEKDNQSGLQAWANSFGGINGELGKIEEKIANDLPKAFVELAKTGKISFKSMASSILSDLAMIIAKEAQRNALEAMGLIRPRGSDPQGSLIGHGVASAYGSGANGNIDVGGLLSKGINGIGRLLNSKTGQPNDGEYGPPAPGSANGGGMDGIGSSISAGVTQGLTWLSSFFSEGGYATNPVSTGSVRGTSFMNAPHYAEGTTNTSGGIPSILHPNEAVIPLSRGRKIPVEMGNSGGHGPVNVTMNVTTNDADSFRASETQIHGRLGSTIQRTLARTGS